MAIGGILVVFLGMALLGVMVAGIFLMARGGETNTKYGNRLMVARVWLQALILLTLAGMFAAGSK
jgi:hypothetical protein